jgi:hypothetical protein
MAHRKQFFGKRKLQTQSLARQRLFRSMRIESLENRCLLTAIPPIPVSESVDLDEHPHGYVYSPPQYRQIDNDDYLTAATPGQPLDIALTYLTQNASKLGLKASDLHNYVVTDQYTSGDLGITHIYLRQTFNGLPVVDADLNVNVTSDGRVVNVGSTFLTGLLQTGSGAVTPTTPATQAYQQLAARLGFQLNAQPAVVEYKGGHSQKTIVSPAGLASENVVAELSYAPTPAGPELAWQLNVPMLKQGHWLYATVSAVDGELLQYHDLAKRATYNVYALPTENPNDGPRTTVTNPQDPVASPFGWHDVNGLPGPEFYDTRGNNVDARQDRDGIYDATGNALPGGQAIGGATLNFNHPLDLTQQPSGYTNAAVTNLFYWVNVSHDIHYQYGFDEVSGNFQATNYTGQGAGNDPVLALAQEDGATAGGTRNNAYFITPPDGTQPVIVMYEWDTDLSDALTANPVGAVYTPNRDGDLDSQVMVHEYGHGVSDRLTGGPANVTALTNVQSAGLAEGWSDYWALAFFQKPTDTKNTPITFNYLNGPNPVRNVGFRRFPYSYDMTIDPLTFADFNAGGPAYSPNSEAHNAGEIWASVLWDMHWLLVEKYGFDPDLYNGQGGNNLALQLVMDGLKLQPANPSFLDARDAILQADLVRNKGVNYKEIWTAFARRGMGVSAIDDTTGTLGSDSESVSAAYDMPINLGAITGTVWRDDNGNNNQDGGEPGLAGRTVFIDLDNDRVRDKLEPVATTDVVGDYRFDFYVAGTFNIAQLVAPTDTQTFPANNGSHTVTITNGQVAANIDFGNRTGATSSFGVKFNDLDGDGRRDANEPGIAGVWIYVDYDGDGRIDLGEPKAQTDAQGRYQLILNVPGNFTVREAIPAGWTQTYPGGATQGHAVSLSSGSMNVSFDFGNAKLDDYSDAPNGDINGVVYNYGVAAHPILAGLHLGAAVDGDAQALVGVEANGDDTDKTDDEDGIKSITGLAPGSTATMEVIVTTKTTTTPPNSTIPVEETLPAGRLNAWIDFNNDGDFLDAGEKVISDQQLAGGTHKLTFPVPANATPGLVYARLRYGYARNQTPTGPDFAGEVEDHRLQILGDKPLAQPDQFAVRQSLRTVLPVLANDIPSANAPTKVKETPKTLTSLGFYEVKNGVLYYTGNLLGADRFEYTIVDAKNNQSKATVTVSVLPGSVFGDPTAVDDSFDVNLDTDVLPKSLDVLANDFAGQTGVISIVNIGTPLFGTVQLDTNNTATPADDVIEYTPDPNSLGQTDEFFYTIQDTNGVQDTATVTVHVKPADDLDNFVQYRLETTDLNGRVIDTIGVGQEFLLNVYVQDVRLNPPDPTKMGVFAGYLDVLYDYRMVAVSGAIDHGSGNDSYSNGVSGSVDLPGLLDEAGGFQADIQNPLGNDEKLLFRIPMTANAPGEVQLVGDPADQTTDNADEGMPPDHDTLLFEPPTAATLQQIGYVNKTLTIVTGNLPIAVDDTFPTFFPDVQINPSVVTILDVLANDFAQTTPTGLTVVDIIVDPNNGYHGAEISIENDGQRIGYKPAQGFVGTEQFQYKMENALGLTATAIVTVQVGAVNKVVDFHVVTTDLNGNEITTIPQGDQFQLRVYVTDIRLNPPNPLRMGVFAAYTDVLYNSALVSTTPNPNINTSNPLPIVTEWGTTFRNGRSGADAGLNLVDEFGAFRSDDITGSGPLNPGPMLLAAITFDADHTGTAVFKLDPADASPLHDVLVIEPDDDSVPLSAITLGSTQITITSDAVGEFAFTNPKNSLDVNDDNAITPQDALWVINATNRQGTGKLSLLSSAQGEGEAAARPSLGFVDVNADGYLSPIDTLQIVNYLNGQSNAQGEGEGELAAPTLEIAPATWIAGPQVNSGNSGPAALPVLSMPEQIGNADLDNSAYLTGQDSDSIFSNWDVNEQPEATDIVDSLAEAVAQVWGDWNGI